jgi:copper oxidase (laccase) domain-containing protein
LRPTRPGHGQLDLGRLAHDALRSLGLAAEAIGRFEDLCTACDPIRFHSFRRDGVRSGRLVHHIRVGSRPPA